VGVALALVGDACGAVVVTEMLGEAPLDAGDGVATALDES